jgi:hypothetical protein
MVENVYSEIELNIAAQKGFKPCKICKPIILKNNNYQSNIARGKSFTIQCNGRTKHGYRCRHKTALANGFCYQHNPNK